MAEISQEIGEFLEWLAFHRVTLCVPHAHSEMCKPSCVRDGLDMLNDSTEKILADYFGIDLRALEAEKRAMLAALRAPAATPTGEK